MALAPGPTAAGFLGNRVRGWAPAGAGKRVALTDFAARGTGGVPIRGPVVVAGRGTGLGLLLVPDTVDVMVEVARADEVAAPVAAEEPAPQPARRRQVSAAAVVAAAVFPGGMVRSVRSDC